MRENGTATAPERQKGENVSKTKSVISEWPFLSNEVERKPFATGQKATGLKADTKGRFLQLMEPDLQLHPFIHVAEAGRIDAFDALLRQAWFW